MRVRYDEGVAIHVGPEPCVSGREARGEASAGERAGQPLSRESPMVPDADAVTKAEGHTIEGTSASSRSIRRGQRPWHARTLLAREPKDLPPTTGPPAVWSAPARPRASAAMSLTGSAASMASRTG